MQFPGNHLPLSGDVMHITWASVQSAGAAFGVTGTLGSAVWPSARRICYVPFRLSSPFLMAQMFVVNGATVSGNFDIGLYAADGTRLMSSGSTVQAGISSIQAVNVTDFLLGAGLFYMALEFDNATATVIRCAPGAITLRMMGRLVQGGR